MNSEIKWIPVEYHRITEEEKQENDYPADWIYYIDSPMPEEGQEILITTNAGYVEKDTCLYDGDTYYTDSGYDWCGEILAWMPLPEPYKNEGEQNKKSDSKISVGDTVFETDGVNVYESTVRHVFYDTESVTFDADAIGSSIFFDKEGSGRKDGTLWQVINAPSATGSPSSRTADQSLILAFIRK